jgi:hypothetical protein
METGACNNLGLSIASANQFIFLIFVMWHRWRSSHLRFSMSGNDPIQGLALMGKIFKKTVKTVKKQ